MVPVRSALKCDLETGVCQRLLRALARHRRDGRARRRGRHHRRPVDRRAGDAAHDADVPHGWRRRPGHHAGPAPSRRAVRGAQAEGPGADRRAVDGKVAVEETDKAIKITITDAKGEEHAYSCRRAPACYVKHGEQDRGRIRSDPARASGRRSAPPVRRAGRHRPRPGRTRLLRHHSAVAGCPRRWSGRWTRSPTATARPAGIRSSWPGWTTWRPTTPAGPARCPTRQRLTAADRRRPDPAQARGPQPHRQPQDQQRARSGAARAADGQDPGDRGDRRRSARGGNRHRGRAARPGLLRSTWAGWTPSGRP